MLWNNIKIKYSILHTRYTPHYQKYWYLSWSLNFDTRCLENKFYWLVDTDKQDIGRLRPIFVLLLSLQFSLKQFEFIWFTWWIKLIKLACSLPAGVPALHIIYSLTQNLAFSCKNGSVWDTETAKGWICGPRKVRTPGESLGLVTFE